MKVLVTGGAGYIATHTIVALDKAGHDIVAVDNFSNSSFDSIEKTQKIIGKQIKFYEGDVRDLALLDKIFLNEKIDAVIHFAGLKAVGESCAKPLEYYDNNLISTLKLLEKMREYGVKRFIFSSSATVYGIPKSLPLTEDAPLSTTNPYGATKLMIENMLRDIYTADNSWHIALLRYFNPVGAHESGLICENPRGIPNNLMPYIAKVATGQLERLSVFGNDYDTKDGTGVRDYIHVMDLAEGHVAALEKIDAFKADAVNLGTGVGYSVLEMVEAFKKASGKPVPYIIAPRRPGDTATLFACCDKAKALLNWEAKRDLKAMCDDLWRALSKN